MSKGDCIYSNFILNIDTQTSSRFGTIGIIDVTGLSIQSKKLIMGNT